jgi:hypothetical protein
MVLAMQAGFDVFNALTMMDNNLFLNEQMVSESGWGSALFDID